MKRCIINSITIDSKISLNRINYDILYRYIYIFTKKLMTWKETSRKAATAASKVLRDARTGKDSKTAAGSALSQREKIPAKKACRPIKPPKK